MNIIKKIFNLDWKQIIPLLKQAHQQTNHSYYYILKDLYTCYKQNYTWVDYFAFDFINHPDLEYRESFITIKRHYPKITKIFNQKKEDNLFFDDKGFFNQNFKKYKPINTLDLRIDNYNKFCDFLDKHQEFFAKEAISCGGKGVKFFSKNKIKQYKKEALFNFLKKHNFNIIEEKIIQHPKLAQLSLNALNTLRVISVKDVDGNITIPFIASRIAIDDAVIDNASSGGAFSILDENGVIVAPYIRYLPKVEIFKNNPITNFNYLGFQFPYFKEIKAMCLEASKHCKNHLIGWDVAINENGPLLIEANNAPTPQLFQSILQLKDGKGQLETLEKALKVKLR